MNSILVTLLCLVGFAVFSAAGLFAWALCQAAAVGDADIEAAIRKAEGE